MFTDEEKKLLGPYVTSTDANIFAVKNMQGMVGAAYARYSRAKGGFREVLLKEFIKEGNIDPKHAADLIERVLIAYGDDSVGELEPAHVSFEKISMVATKEIEDRRIGGSPIEQSTRYVFYDQKDDAGNWMYYRGPEIMNSSVAEKYVHIMDEIFQTYANLVEPLKTHLESMKPLAEAEYDIDGSGEKKTIDRLTDEKQTKAFKQTYTFELRAKACDILRSILPLATLTNVGMLGNGRFFQHVISFLMTSELPEAHAIAEGTKDALNQIIPVYIRRARRYEYNAEINRRMYTLAHELTKNLPASEPVTEALYELMNRGERILESWIKAGKSAGEALNEAEEIAMLSMMLYPFANVSLVSLRNFVQNAPAETRQKIKDTYVSERKARRDRPGRALESGYPLVFDLVTNFGVYKDLQRHRMNSQSRQLFTTKLGFDFQPELDAIGSRAEIMKCVNLANELYDLLLPISPFMAQYAVLHGHFVRWSLSMNDREAMHLIELRSTPQGHPNYRKAAQAMHKLIKVRSGWRGDMISFADHNDYYWSRADSEAKQRVKEAKLDEQKTF